MTSSKNIPFLERSLPSVFAPSRNTGLMVHDSHGDAVNWAIGVFRESDGFGSSSGGGVGVTGRIGWRPIYEDGGRKMLHVGLSASVRDTKDQGDSYRLRQRPDVHLSPRFVDTGGFATDGVELLSPRGCRYPWALLVLVRIHRQQRRSSGFEFRGFRRVLCSSWLLPHGRAQEVQDLRGCLRSGPSP